MSRARAHQETRAAGARDVELTFQDPVRARVECDLGDILRGGVVRRHLPLLIAGAPEAQLVLLRTPDGQESPPRLDKGADQDMDAFDGLPFQILPDAEHGLLGRDVRRLEGRVVESIIRGDISRHVLRHAGVNQDLLAVGHQLVGSEIAADDGAAAPDGGPSRFAVAAVAFHDRQSRVGEESFGELGLVPT